jgi:hypothetical protein
VGLLDITDCCRRDVLTSLTRFRYATEERTVLSRYDHRLLYRKIADRFEQLHGLELSGASAWHATERAARAGHCEYEQIRQQMCRIHANRTHLRDFQQQFNIHNSNENSMAEPDVQEFLDRKRKADAYLDRLCSWAERGGNPLEWNLRYEDPKRNVYGLAAKLAWWFGDFDDAERVVSEVLEGFGIEEKVGMDVHSIAIWAVSQAIQRNSYYHLNRVVKTNPMTQLTDDDRENIEVPPEIASSIIQLASLIRENPFKFQTLLNHDSLHWGATDIMVEVVLSELKKCGYLSMTRNQFCTKWTKERHIPIAGSEFEALIGRYAGIAPQPTSVATDSVESW